MKQLIAPILPTVLAPGDWDQFTDYDVLEDCHFQNQTILGSFHDIELKHCQLTNCDFSQADIHGMNCIHVIFDHCDLSNFDFNNVAMHHVIFRNCKLMGMDCSMSSMKHVQILSCLGRFANFSFATIDYFLIQESDFTESVWNEVTWKHRNLSDSNFQQAEFLNTSLRELDVTSCEIAGIRVTTDSLVGVQVSALQAVSLTELFGIIVKE